MNEETELKLLKARNTLHEIIDENREEWKSIGQNKQPNWFSHLMFACGDLDLAIQKYYKNE